MRFRYFIQPDQLTCGPTCIRMIANYYGKNIPLQRIVENTGTDRNGSSMLGLTSAAEGIGFRVKALKMPFYRLLKENSIPFIGYWKQNHFVVVYKITKRYIFVADPACGLLKYSFDDFEKCWANSDGEGIVLLMDPTSAFINLHIEKNEKRSNIAYLKSYIKIYRGTIIKLILFMLIISGLQMVLPFLTQEIVDVGIKTKNISIIYLILIAQLLVFAGKISFEIARNYTVIKLSTKINISMLSDFFAKLMRLPIAYFDKKVVGDIIQRIYDNNRIENFLTGSSISTLFSIINLFIMSFILGWYNLSILFIFLTGSAMYFAYILVFMRQRAKLDYKRFQQGSQNHSNVVELVNSMQEIKLHNAEESKRVEWQKLQEKIFKINLQALSLTSAQNSGSGIINELKNIIITFVAAKLVIENNITLGMMLSISYMIGQLNAPILDMVNFMRNWQDAKLSIERLSEIQTLDDEEKTDFTTKSLQAPSSIVFRNIFFKYQKGEPQYILKDINCVIPKNNITAIVGSSGSGKTTLLKLLLRYYTPLQGSIQLGELNFSQVHLKEWRKNIGVVMQEGYIFSDTIAKNIAVGEENVDFSKLSKAAYIANIHEFIESLPFGYNTKIGMEGTGLSTGQKQRILIARAVYKDPMYLFFDEATSALDANNERIIMNNLQSFFTNRTVVIIAHRLSTVKNADQILVLDRGEIVEFGNHLNLSVKKGLYYELVKNQLELGN